MAFTPRTDNLDDVMAVDVNEAYGCTLTNRSGAGRVLGDVVIQDTANDSSFTTTTTEADPKVIGVVAESIASLSSGVVMNGGPMAGIKCDAAAVTRGQYLITSTTATRATPTSTWQTGVFAIALTAKGAGVGTVTAWLLGERPGGTLELRVASGDPQIVFDIAGTDKFTFGVDDDDSDKLKISQGSALGTNDVITIHGSNVGIGTTGPVNQLEVIKTAIGATPVDINGIRISNTTAAAAGAQQYSPPLVFQGQGWKTDATAASQKVEFMQDVRPVQGAANPTGYWGIYPSINDAAYSATPAIAVTSAGNVGIGTTGPLGKLEVSGGAAVETCLSSYANSDDGSRLNFYKARGTSGTPLAVVNNDLTAQMYFWGYDGNSWENTGAIFSAVDGTPGDNNMPGRLQFYTQQITGLVERMRITSTGNVGIGIASSLLGKVHIDQSSTTAAIPPLVLDQADLSEELIKFITTIGVGNPIEAIAAKTLTTTHFIRVEIPGPAYVYIPCGTIA